MPHRRMVQERFSGTLCVDELHLGPYPLLLATDPLADLPVGFALVGANDQDHMRRFLANLARGGLRPEVVVNDGSSLYPVPRFPVTAPRQAVSEPPDILTGDRTHGSGPPLIPPPP